MRIIIEPSSDAMSKWAAIYIINKINHFKPTPKKHLSNTVMTPFINLGKFLKKRHPFRLI